MLVRLRLDEPRGAEETGRRENIANKLYGHLTGLKPHQVRLLERLYRRSVPPNLITTTELTAFLCECSAAVRRQVGVLLDRGGRVDKVVVGDARKLVLPHMARVRKGPGRLSGIRLLHTHLGEQGLDRDDLTDLTRLALDLVAAVTMDGSGEPRHMHVAHLVPHDPRAPAGTYWNVLPHVPWHTLDIAFDELVQALEAEFRQRGLARRATQEGGTAGEQAIVVQVDDGSVADPEASLAELKELARTAGVTVVDAIVQRRRVADHRYVMGRGKLEELILQAMHRDVELVIFDRDLTPAQVRAISDLTELKVIDRTQLILDIFAQRATTRAGKRRVELAQLKYMLPRLVGRGSAMSRLTGGIGGRGPGETRLEMDRRRVKTRIHRLEREIEKLGKDRALRRRRRERRELPVIGIVGYTNAGKSTLLNALTDSGVVAEDKLFATLDPTSRRLRFPEEREVILTDTVGFIRDLPEDLVSAFLATLEELQSADLLLHVVDAASPHTETHIEAVNGILMRLELDQVSRLLVFNKVDMVTDSSRLERLCAAHAGVPVSALRRDSLRPLLSRAARLLWPETDDEPEEADEDALPLFDEDGVATERIA